MTNQLNNKNNQSTSQSIFQTIGQNKIEAFLNQSNKLLVLNLNDLNADILNVLKARQCLIVLLNENFKITEDVLKDLKTKQLQHISLTINSTKQVVRVEHIIRFEASGNYTKIYLKYETKPVLTSRTLKYYVKQLDNATFLRPHKSHLVNSAFVDEVILKPKANLILKNGKQIRIARRKLKMFSIGAKHFNPLHNSNIT